MHNISGILKEKVLEKKRQIQLQDVIFSKGTKDIIFRT